ncbi:MAG: hypothetical protein K0A93_08505 [Desulfuromonadaceae bacterium]|nr:hypothetical protein [Desulfuromonadaceae bacterium]
MTNRTFTWLLIVLILSMTTGCAGKRAFSRGEDALLHHDYAAAVDEFTTAVEEDPGKHEYRISLLTARAEAAQHHLKQARGLTDEEQYAEAAGELERALSYDPGLDVAGYELNKIRKRLEMKNRLDEARAFYRERRLPQAQRVIDEILKVNPDQADALALNDQIRSEGRTLIDGVELEVASDEPITLKFKDADLKDVFNILSQLSGINFIFDGEIRSEKISILLENGTFGQALELLLNMNKLDKKILNSKSIIIYPLSKEKAKQYEDQVIQTFYLSNIDAKKAVNLLRTMLQLRKVYVHEELNALVIRDTPEVIKLAKQLLEAADRQDAEVIFDLELVEISHGDGLKIGPKLSDYSLQVGINSSRALTTTTGGTGPVTTNAIGPVVLESLRDLRGIDFLYGLPSASFDLAKTKTDSEILANPQIRVRNKEKAKVHVGTREPVITVTTSGDNVTENIQYVDVGVKLDVEPTVQLDNTVITKITLEVSSVSDRTQTNNGSIALTITTTNAQTALTLKDGEQTIIGGLIRDNNNQSKSTIPFLGDIPLLGDLFTGYSRDKNKREILLSITPHIVRKLNIPDADVASIWSGGEDQLKAGARFSSFAKELTAAVNEPPQIPVPAQAADAGGQRALEPIAAPEDHTSTEQISTLPGMDAMTAMQQLPGGMPHTAMPDIAPPVEVVNVPPLDIPPLPAGGRLAWNGATLVKQGDTFTVDAVLSGVGQLFSAPLFVDYDPEMLEFVRLDEGDFLKQAGATTIFTSSPDRSAGRIIVGAKQGAGGSGASGDGVLFRATFRALTQGLTTLNFDRINFRDPGGTRLTTEVAPLNIEVR